MHFGSTDGGFLGLTNELLSFSWPVGGCRIKPLRHQFFSGSERWLPSCLPFSSAFNTFCSYLKCHICTRTARERSENLLVATFITENCRGGGAIGGGGGGGGEDEGDDAAADNHLVVCPTCANSGGGNVACWFVGEQTQTGGEHLSCDGRTEGRVPTQPRVGGRGAVERIV